MKQLAAEPLYHLLALFLAGLLALAAPGIASAAEAGRFQFVSGSVKVVSAAGVERTAAKGDPFNAGDTLVTGPASSAQIRMSDGGLMAIRADTQMKLDQYVFSGREDGTERKLVSLIKGGFRTITGLIGNRNKDNYKIFTPSATIGIRGTDHEPVVIPPGTVGAQAGTYDRVYRGATVIETDKGKLIVNPNQVGFTPGKGVAPVLLPKVPDFYDSKPGRPDAAKEPQKDSKESSDDGTGEKTKSTTSTRTRSTLKSEAVKDAGDTSSAKESAATLRSPLEASPVKDLGTLKSDALSTPLTDTTVKPTTTITDTTSTLKSDVLTAPTTTLKSTETLTAPVTTTIRAPTTTTTTTVAPITSTITKPTTVITTPITTTTTTTTTTTVPRTVETITAPVTTTIKK